jgi:hypothetical protein
MVHTANCAESKEVGLSYRRAGVSAYERIYVPPARSMRRQGPESMAHNQRDLELKGYGTTLNGSKAYAPTLRYADTPTHFPALAKHAQTPTRRE